MTHALLIDTNHAAVPIYHSLGKMSHEVRVVGGMPTETSPSWEIIMSSSTKPTQTTFIAYE